MTQVHISGLVIRQRMYIGICLEVILKQLLVMTLRALALSDLSLPAVWYKSQGFNFKNLCKL
jgi:hypothetical protein